MYLIQKVEGSKETGSKFYNKVNLFIQPKKLVRSAKEKSEFSCVSRVGDRNVNTLYQLFVYTLGCLVVFMGN